MDGSLISQTGIELLEDLDDDYYKEYEIREVGIVVILESNDHTMAKTRSSSNLHYIKVGMWELARDSIRHGRQSDND